ncbi:MAG: BspA family leucine-rich repeat surface protein [Candidatus Saccharibacteria bacterium]|nr:BspA family leucine-rich repeat surface protein [Candidatus Saccharibacteria bacterium]
MLKNFRRERKTRQENRQRKITTGIFALATLGLFGCIASSFAATIIKDGSRVGTNAELKYYLTVKEDGVDINGVESSDTVKAQVRSGIITVTDTIPYGLTFENFVTTSDGTIGAVARSDSATACSGKVIDDTNEESETEGKWNADNTEFTYHGLHYNANTRTVSFAAENVQAGCELTVGIVTTTPATVDDPDTAIVERRRDFFNTAFASEKNNPAISNTVYVYMGESEALMNQVSYKYTGDIPSDAPASPSAQRYATNSKVSVVKTPNIEGYKFSGWNSSDVDVEDDVFVMPDRDIELVGVWTKDLTAQAYNVSYQIDGEKPEGYMTPKDRQYIAGSAVDLDALEADSVIDGYKFKGWKSSDVALTETGFIMPGKDIVVAGEFERIGYDVCYEFIGQVLPPNAESLIPSCIRNYPGNKVSLAPNPKADGYKFTGWYAKEGFIMPEENVVIRGEWGVANGVFSPKIEAQLTNPSSSYKLGEMVKFKITVTNSEQFDIEDVFIEEQLQGTAFVSNDGYENKSNSIAKIPKLKAGESIDLFAEYEVVDDENINLENVIEIIGATAGNQYYLDTDKDYIARVGFNVSQASILSPKTLDSIVKYLAIFTISAAGLLVVVLFFTKKVYRNKRLIKISAPCLAIASVIIGGVIAKSVSAMEYTEVIKSINLTSTNSSFANNESGAWNIRQNAEWIKKGVARVTFNVESIAKVKEDKKIDVVMVLDNSGSMDGDKINRVKEDSIGLIDTLLSDADNRIGLITFNSNAEILSELTNDRGKLVSMVESLNSIGATNYYDGLLKVEKLLADYESKNKDLIVLFLTDGFPNESTPNEVAESKVLRQMYPNMIINGVQYEMGYDVLDPIKQISDNQFIADMSSLNNVLFKASVMPNIYDEFSLDSVIDGDYWTLIEDSINTTLGDVSLSYNKADPVVSWNMNGQLISGSSAKMSVDLKIKDESSIESFDDIFMPTNKSSAVVTKIDGASDENIKTNNSPVLKNNVSVTYDSNLPANCANAAGNNPEVKKYLPYTVVEKSEEVPVCNGYNFYGWVVSEGDHAYINDDYFRLSFEDVKLRAAWTKVSIEKSMEGEVKKAGAATFSTGSAVNAALKELTGQSNTSFNTTNNAIKSIVMANTMSLDQENEARIISDPTSDIPIYAWYDNSDEGGVIYLYSDAGELKMNKNSSYMFSHLDSLSSIDVLAEINTSGVENMSNMFFFDHSITSLEPLANWDTSSVKNMGFMFKGTNSTYQPSMSITSLEPLANWDTSNVTNMSNMFYGNSMLTSLKGLEKWNTGKVTNMSYMFSGDKGSSSSISMNIASLEPLADWDISNVTDTSYMFQENNKLTSLEPLAKWNTSNIRNMSYMFCGNTGSSEARYQMNITSLAGLENWDTSKVVNMSWLFARNPKIESLDPIANWNTENVSYMTGTFMNGSAVGDHTYVGSDYGYIQHYAFATGSTLTSLKPLAKWNTSKVTDLSITFAGLSLNTLEGLEDWDTSNVTDMSFAFESNKTTTLDALANWNVSKVYNMKNIFDGASRITSLKPLSNWDTSNVSNLSAAFLGASKIASLDGLENWNTSKVSTIYYIFGGASANASIEAVRNWNLPRVTNMSGMFYENSSLTSLEPISGWDTSNITKMTALFSSNSNLTSLSPIANWNTSKVTNMSKMFERNTILSSLNDLENWDTGNVTDMSSMFNGDSGLTSLKPIANWNISNVVNMSNMFGGNTKLTSLDGLEKWNTSNVTNMSYMFRNNSSLASLAGLGKWDTSKVTDMSNMFENNYGNVSLAGLEGWNTSNVTNMSYMFSCNYKLASLNPLADWDTSKVKKMDYMFKNDSKITTLEPLKNWDTTALTSQTGIFTGVPSSVPRPW